MALKVENLKFSYFKKQILDGLNIECKSGEIIGILGPNGCGKSTLLKNILRILDFQSGNIIISNKPLNEYSDKELAKIIGFVPQKQCFKLL